MEQAFIALLLSDSALVALVGDRIKWGTLTQGSVNPAVVLHLISDVPDYHMLGPSGLVESRIQIDCRGTSKASAKAAANAVQDLLSGYTGTVGSIKFQGIFKDSERSSFEKPTNGSEAFHLASADYRVFTGLAA